MFDSIYAHKYARNSHIVRRITALQLAKPSALTCEEIKSSFPPRHLDIYVVRSTSKLSAIDGTNTFLIREKTATTGDDFKEDHCFPLCLHYLFAILTVQTRQLGV